MERCFIGGVHPLFFEHGQVFKKFRKDNTERGLCLSSPLLDSGLTYSDGYLIGDSKEVLWDIQDLVKEHYGCRVTKKEFKEMLDFDAIEWGSKGVLNVGVCVLADNTDGWDGSINAIWFGDDAPGRVVDVYFQYWSTDRLMGAAELSLEDLGQCDKSVVLPNLTDALILAEGRDSKKVENLIKQIV